VKRFLKQVGWKLALMSSGYGFLIKEYVRFLLAKLSYHREHPEFNGIASTLI
jgi:hypothetical protein